MDQIHLYAYFGVIILAGVFRSNGGMNPQHSFGMQKRAENFSHATISLENLHVTNRDDPGPDVTADEHLISRSGQCLFKSTPSKPAKYGVKSGAAWDATSSFA